MGEINKKPEKRESTMPSNCGFKSDPTSGEYIKSVGGTTNHNESLSKEGMVGYTQTKVKDC